MSAIVRADEGLIWFLTDTSTGSKDNEIANDRNVAVIFTDGSSTHVAVSGTASIVTDRATVKDLWSTPAQAFYPQGPEDPAIVALRVKPGMAELWDGPSTPVALVQMAAALVTGGSAADIGRNVKADLR
jgi:general stress protein 26